MDFRKEYQAYPSRELAKIANAIAGEYRPEAIEAARIELANRGESWQKRKSGFRNEKEGMRREGAGIGRRESLITRYVVCLALLGFGTIRLMISLISLYRQGGSSFRLSDFALPCPLILISLFGLWGLHRRLFRGPRQEKETNPLLNFFARLDSFRPPPIEGETDPERDRSRNK